MKNRQQNGITRCSEILKMDNQQRPETKSHVCALSLDMTGDCMICAIERERDEALMDRASGDIATMTINHYERLIKERDEARAVAGELADVASKYLSFLLAVTPSKTNETHEKETIRVIDAIKRWKKL
jgi:hypothetical protein